VRRALLAITGVLLAFLVGMVALAVLLVVELASLPPAMHIDILTFAAWIGAAAANVWTVSAWTGMIAVCFLPVALVGLVGEIARWRSFLWYAGATGALTAAVPTLARAALDTTPDRLALPLEAHMTLMLFLSGVVAGLVYWLIAGRSATVA
jgi:hypothetical protein